MDQNLKELFAGVRADFPMLRMEMHGKPLIYLDTAATAQKPQCVIDAICNFYTHQYGTVHRAVYDLSLHATSAYNQARLRVQKFLGASRPEEIIFTRGTTESINLVAYSFGKAFVEPGDEILISEIEHHSNIVPWQLLCEDRGANLRVIPVNDAGEIIWEAFEKLLNRRTKLVAIAHISNALGTIHPIKKIIERARTVRAKVLIDGAQAAPHLPVDVQELDADFYVFSGHKLYGPTGVGVLYGKAELLDAMPPYQGGGDMIDEVTFPKTSYNVLPMKFEAGTPLIAEVLGLGVAVDYLQKLGMARVAAWKQKLFEYALERLQQIKGIRFIGTARERGALISFVIEGIHPLDLGTLLNLHGVAMRTGHHCAQPAMRRFGVTGTARISFGIYTTLEEIDQLIIALKSVVQQLWP